MRWGFWEFSNVGGAYVCVYGHGYICIYLCICVYRGMVRECVWGLWMREVVWGWGGDEGGGGGDTPKDFSSAFQCGGREGFAKRMQTKAECCASCCASGALRATHALRVPCFSFPGPASFSDTIFRDIHFCKLVSDSNLNFVLCIFPRFCSRLLRSWFYESWGQSLRKSWL